MWHAQLWWRRAALYQQPDVTCAILAMMPDRPIGRTVIPGLGDREGWKLDDGDALHRVTFKLFERRVGSETLGVIALQRRTDFRPVGFQFLPVEDYLTH